MTDEDAILAANEAFYTAFANGDFPAMEQLWSRTGPVACVHPGWSAIVGRDEVMASWRAILGKPPRIVAGTPRLFAYGPVAFVLCREYVDSVVLAATNIFAKEADGWKLVHHQGSPTPEAGEPPAPVRRQVH